MMDAQKKAEWVAALRSGEYKQGNGRLYCPDENSYCCLGVLAKLNGLSVEEDQDGGLEQPVYQAVLKVIGGDSVSSLVRLTQRNDGAGQWERPWTFSGIADFIEKEY